MRAVVCVPYRTQDADRIAAWGYVRAWFEALGLPVFEGDTEGEFSRSGARNAAAAAAGDWDVAVFSDAETFPDRAEVVHEAIAVAHERGRWVNVARDYGRLDAQQTARVLAGEAPERSMCAWRRRSPPVGGIFAVPRPLWDAVGGFDEGFRGWGFEDSAFAVACRVFGGQDWCGGFVYHLWHEESARGRGGRGPQWEINNHRFQLYQRANSPAAMRALLDAIRT